MDIIPTPANFMEFGVILAAVTIANVVAAGTGYYRAAVVELRPIAGLNAEQNLIGMNREYGNFIRTASNQQVDIIVFPEAGLYGSDYSLFHNIPDPKLKIVPAGNASYDELVQQLSRYAKQYSIYIAVNLLETYTNASQGTEKYNTNVVFDRKGAVVARYRKFNLYGEPVSRTARFEPSYFDSDFGVRFGQIIGLDILYREPPIVLMKEYNITDFIYSSEWFSGLPFLTAAQTQWMFSVGNDVNLLAAGLNRIERGSSGSGIYRGRNAPIGFLNIFGDWSIDGIVIGNVSIGGPKSDYSGRGEASEESLHGQVPFPLLRQQELDLMTNENIEFSADSTVTNFVKQICHGSLCCNFDLTLSSEAPLNKPFIAVRYKAVVFDGHRTLSAPKTKLVQGVQVCGVVMCSNGAISSCGPPAVNWTLPNLQTPPPNIVFNSIAIAGNFSTNDSSVLPNVLLWPIPPTYYTSAPPKHRGEFLIDPRMVNFVNNGGGARLVMQPNKKIISCGIFTRVFSRDAQSPTNNSYRKTHLVSVGLLPFNTLVIYYLRFGVL